MSECDGSGNVIRRFECPICGIDDTDDEVTCIGPLADRHEATKLLPRVYVAVDALLSPEARSAGGTALFLQLENSRESGSYADVNEEAAIAIRAAIKAIGGD